MDKLIQQHSEELLLQPESGMGFQIVRARWSRIMMMDNEFIEGVCFNAELFVQDKELVKILKSFNYEKLLEGIETKTEFMRDFKVLTSSEIRKNSLINEMMGAKQLIEIFNGIPRKEEIFKRFSAYKKDRRVTPDKGLFPGTYATTKNDSTMVPSGLSAVARYALPNCWPAKYVFTIKPSQGTKIKCGTVTPAFNQAGGGVEVCFDDGTECDTVERAKDLPER